MKRKLLDYLACPSCGGDLALAPKETTDGTEIMEGELRCACAKTYPISRGVPRFVDRGELPEDKAATAENFGWEWHHFTRKDERYAEQFLGWIGPVRPDFFRDKVVLEGGCGKGRHTLLASDWGAKDIVSIDLSHAVDVAFRETRDRPNAHIVQADIFKMPFKRCFDYAFSVGVLHHLPDPEGGFRALASKVKVGGHVSAWVYGAESNEWITNFVDPLRKAVTSRMSKRALLEVSKLPTAALYAATKLVYGPLGALSAAKPVHQRLFYKDYLTHLATFGWEEQHHIVFDHLVAPTAFYISGPEFQGWWDRLGAEEVTVRQHNGMSWSGLGRIAS